MVSLIELVLCGPPLFNIAIRLRRRRKHQVTHKLRVEPGPRNPKPNALSYRFNNPQAKEVHQIGWPKAWVELLKKLPHIPRNNCQEVISEWRNGSPLLLTEETIWRHSVTSDRPCVSNCAAVSAYSGESWTIPGCPFSKIIPAMERQCWENWSHACWWM